MPELVISGTLVFASPLFIGAGGSRPGIDKSTLQYQGHPFIPGSSIKGRVRHNCERIIQTLGGWCCESADPETTCPHHQWVTAPASGECPICRIFGSPWLKSPLVFSDWMMECPQSIAEESWKEWRKTSVRWGVSINRRRGTAQEDRLYVFETAVPRQPAQWRGEIYGSLASEALAGLLYAGLLALRTVGGGSGRGLGWLEEASVAALAIRWGNEDRGGPEWLRTQLQALEEVLP